MGPKIMADIGRIKSNIQIMIDKGASEDEIDSYVSSEGVTLEQLQAKTPPAPQAPLNRGPNAIPERERYSGAILPISENESGGVDFDSNAGILGPIKRAIMLPGQVMRGEVDATSNEGRKQSLEAALMMSPMGAASRVGRSALNAQSAYRQPLKAVPTRKELKSATDLKYGEARAMGAEYTPQSISKWADETANALNSKGILPPNYPKVHNLLNAVKTPPKDAKSITLESVDAFYKELGRLGGDPAEGGVASMVQRQLDDFHSSLSPSDLVAGTATPQKAAAVLKEARGNAAAGFRSDRVTGIEKTSARRTAAANSGMNADNNIRQRLTSFIESAKGSRGLSEIEENAIDDIIFGRPSKNAARYIGNLLGGGGGLGTAMLTGGSAVGGAAAFGTMGAMLAAAPPVVGAIARQVANGMSRKELKALDDLLRSRSPLANQTPMPAQVYQPGMVQGGAESMAKALGAKSMEQDPAKDNSELMRALMENYRAGGA